MLEDRLRLAVAADEVGVVYQPIVDLATGERTAVEALARWTDPVEGRVSPDVFIEVAERRGLIGELGRSVLAQACAQAARWRDLGVTGERLCVNVSPIQLRAPGFAAAVEEVVAEAGIDPSLLCLEVTENAIVSELPRVTGAMGRLAAAGIEFALDDFGTGHSSLALLRRLPVHTVKIDRSLIAAVGRDVHDAVLVQLIIDAAHSLALRVCAEGIELEEQARELVAMGCDTGQGWFFGRPVSAAAGRPFPAQPTDGAWLAADEPAPGGHGQGGLVVVSDTAGTVTYVSASVRRLLGRSPSELLGHQVETVLGVQPAAGEVTVQVAHVNGEPRWLRGETREFRDPSDAGTRSLTVLSDDTATVRREQVLADTEELLRSAFDQAPIGIALSDFEGRILRVNPAFAHLLGYRTDELLTRTVDEITHPDDRPVDEANLADITASPERQQVFKRYLHAQGHPVAVEVHASLVRTADGALSCVVAHVLPL